MATLKMFRPSEVEHFAFCPAYWSLRKANWYPRIATKAMVAAIWSTGAHAAFALYWRMKMDGCTDAVQLLTSAQCEAVQVYVADINHFVAAGVNFGALDTDSAATDLRKLVANYASKCKLALSGWSVVSVEESLDGEGTTRPDVIVRDPEGILCPVDYKIKRSVNPKWFDHQGWADEFEFTHKQLNYISLIQQRAGRGETFAVYGAEVVKFSKNRHYLYTIVAEPFAQLLTHYDISDEYMERWYTAAVHFASRMRGTLNPDEYLHPTHKSPYGMCELLDMCTKGDKVMGYVKVPKRVK